MIKKLISTGAILAALASTNCNKDNRNDIKYYPQVTETNSIKNIDLITEQNLDQITSKRYTVIRITADWCAPCKMYDPIFKCLSEKKSGENVTFAELDITNLDNLKRFFKEATKRDMLKLKSKGMGIPTTFFLYEGKEVNRYTGLNDATEFEVENVLDSLLNKNYDYRKDYTAEMRCDTIKGTKKCRIEYFPRPAQKARPPTNYNSVFKKKL